jgi:transposase
VRTYFNLEFDNSSFSYSLNKERIEKEQKPDGVYVIRTSIPDTIMSIDDCVRQYKNFTQVECAFRTVKTPDLRVRPIYHRSDERIKYHLFLTVLSYYAEYFMRQARNQLTFADPKLKK